MARTLTARYFPMVNILYVKKGYMPSYTRRSIHDSLWVLHKGGYWRVGSGLDVCIWQDSWIPTQNGYKLLSPPIGLEVDARVFELINHENRCWQENLVHEIFYPFEPNQILAIPLSTIELQDKFCWQGTRDRVYKARSAYHLIRESVREGPEHSGNMQRPTDRIWLKIWMTNTLPNSKLFLWRLVHDVLPVMSNLERRSVPVLPVCPRCFQAEETSSHAIFS